MSEPVEGNPPVAAPNRWLGSVRRFLHEAKAGFSGYTLASYSSQVANMLGTLLVLRWLPPTQLGLWQTMLLVETYAMVLRLGVINGMNRQLPLLMGRGEDAAARDHAETALTYTLLIAGALFLGFLGAAALWPGENEIWRLSLITLACYTPCGLYSAFNEATFRGSRTFSLLGRVLLLNALLGLGLLLLVARFGYTGHCARLLILSLSYALLTHVLRPLKLRPRFSAEVFRKLIKVGLPLFAQNYLLRISLSACPLVLLWLGGSKALGLFAPVTAVFSVVGLMPNSLMSYVQPQQHFDYGQHGSAAAIVQKATRLTFVLMLASVPFALLGLPAIPWAVRTFIPEYIAATSAMQVAVVIGLIRIFSVATSVYSTLAAWKEMFVNQFALGLSHVLGALSGALLMPERPWLGVTWGLLAAYMLYIPVTLRSLRSVATSY